MSKISLSSVRYHMFQYIHQGFEPYALIKILHVKSASITFIFKNKSISKQSVYYEDILKIQNFFLQTHINNF